MVRNKNLGSRVADIVIYVLLGLSALMCLAPVIHILAISLSDKAAAEAGRVFFWPVSLTFLSYDQIINDAQFMRSFMISLERVVLGVGINFLLMVMSAYPLSRSHKDFPGRNIYMWIVVFTILFSGGLIPTYIIINKLSLIDTIWALVLPGAVPVWNIILLMNFFRSLPKELEEACVVDGAGPWYILFRMFIPLSLPAIATVTLFSIVGHWNAFFDGLIYMNKPWNYPLQSYIYKLTVVTTTENLSKMSAEDIKRLMAVSSKTFNAAKIFVTMLPVLLIYPFMQKYFVKGIVLGSVKG